MNYRVAIIGGGPAGMSAALWLHNLGCQPVILEAEPFLGGQMLNNTVSNNWVLGLYPFSGLELAKKYEQHIAKLNIQSQVDFLVHRINHENNQWLIHGSKKTPPPFDALLIATGLRERQIDNELIKTGLADIAQNLLRTGSEAYCHKNLVTGKKILIIGGGDNAFENADFLVKLGARVILLSRTKRLNQHRLTKQIAAHIQSKACEWFCPASLTHISLEQSKPLKIKIRTLNGDIERECDAVHCLLGYTPNKIDTWFEEPLTSTIEYDPEPYIKSKSLGRTNINRLYVAGDLCHKEHPCVLSALSSGAAAARAIEIDLHTAFKNSIKQI